VANFYFQCPPRELRRKAYKILRLPDIGGRMSQNIKINVTISKELDEKFRNTVAKTLGFKKGNLQVAIEEAIEMWISEKEKQLKRQQKRRK